jgi:CRP-like cAMP-binding protein
MKFAPLPPTTPRSIHVPQGIAAIGKRLGVPRRTVTRWMQELRQEWTARAAEGAALLVPVKVARPEFPTN